MALPSCGHQPSQGLTQLYHLPVSVSKKSCQKCHAQFILGGGMSPFGSCAEPPLCLKQLVSPHIEAAELCLGAGVASRRCEEQPVLSFSSRLLQQLRAKLRHGFQKAQISRTR